VLRDHLSEVIHEACDAQVVATADTETKASTWMREHPGDWDLAVRDRDLEKVEFRRGDTATERRRRRNPARMFLRGMGKDRRSLTQSRGDQ